MRSSNWMDCSYRAHSLYFINSKWFQCNGFNFLWYCLSFVPFSCCNTVLHSAQISPSIWKKKHSSSKKNALMLTNKFNNISEIDEFHRIFIKASVCIRIDALLIFIASCDMHSICIALDVKNFIWLMLIYTHKKWIVIEILLSVVNIWNLIPAAC